MKINPLVFRNYDVRGIYPADLNQEAVFRIVSAFIDLYPGAKKIVLAHDSRLSSPALKEAAVAAMLANGRQIIDLGLAPDPLFSFALNHYDFAAGIMITASHNPAEYNGLVLNLERKGVSREAWLEIKQRAIAGRFKKRKRRGKIICFNPENDYFRYLHKRANLKKPLKIIFDSGNGAMGFLPERFFKELGCQVKTIFGEPDGRFPNRSPDPYHQGGLETLKKTVQKQRADLGFAFDGDGDRVIVINNRGERVKEDYCLFILASHVLRRHPGAVVCDVRVSDFFLKAMEKRGVKTYFSISHHNAIIEKIRKEKAVFGGEVTSHYFFPKEHYLCDDALFSALKLAEAASEHDDWSEYLQTLPSFFATPEIFIPVPDEEKQALMVSLKALLKQKNMAFIDVDGARIKFKNGWALARASSTSPFIKVRFEGKTARDLKEVQKKAEALFAQAGIKR